MARKKEIENLVRGIVGEPQQLRNEDEDGNVAPEVVAELGITPEMEEQLNEVRKARVGRKKGTERAKKNPDEGRATFVVSNRLIRKFKYISLADSRLLKDIVAEAMSEYIDKWEEENGVIRLPRGSRRKEAE